MRARTTNGGRRQLARSRIALSHRDVDYVVAARGAWCKPGRIRRGVYLPMDRRDEHRVGSSDSPGAYRTHVGNAAAMGSSAGSSGQRSTGLALVGARILAFPDPSARVLT